VTEQELAVDAVRRLNRVGIAYLLTGSMASNYWGIPRTTHDLDFVVQLPLQSIPSLLHEFRDDFYLDEPAVRAALVTPYQFNAIDRRSALKIDFWMLRSNPFEMSMFDRRLSVNLLGEPAWIATSVGRERYLKSGGGRKFLRSQLRNHFAKHPLRTAWGEAAQ
jgi:hypothetical protein